MTQPMIDTGGGAQGLLDALALSTMPVPVVGDVAGLASDAYRFATDPESRTLGNAAWASLGMLPFVPYMGAIRAYHGSPHTFDAFDMSKIGTGEGAQVYGHGLYFSENPEVAGRYHDMLAATTRAHNTFRGKKFTPKYIAELAGDADPDIASFFRYDAPQHRLTTTKKTGEWIESKIAANDADAARYRQRLADYEANPPFASTYGPDDFRKFISNYEKDTARLQKVLADLDYVPERKSGAVYAVDLEVDPEDLLDWGAPLSQQSEKVQKAVKSLLAPSPQQMADDDALLTELMSGQGSDDLMKYAESAQFPEMTGAAIYDALSNSGSNSIFSNRAAASASDRLRAAGIPGIKYMGEFRKTEGEGARNFVLFDEKLARILERNGQPVE